MKNQNRESIEDNDIISSTPESSTSSTEPKVTVHNITEIRDNHLKYYNDK